MADRITLTRTFGDEHKGRAGHINIQHYAQFIEDARHAWLSAEGMPAGRLKLTEEKVRFSGELHSGDTASLTAHYFHQHNRVVCATELVRAEDGVTVNRCLQYFQTPEPLAGLASGEAEFDLRDIAVDASPGAEFVSFEGQVPVDVNGTSEHLSARGLWYLMTEAMWSVQNRIGASAAYLASRNIGGGASMFQLTHHEPIPANATLHTTTTLIGHSDSSLRYQHDIRADEKPDSHPMVTARYVLTYFDRKTGQRHPIPETLLKALIPDARQALENKNLG